MRISVRLTVEVDKDLWASAYGIDPGEVRGDVKRYIANGATSAEDALIRVVCWK